MSKHRLKAYTLMELVIAMLLSALVISIAFTAFSVISRSYTTFRRKNNEIAVVLRLNELLQKDMVKADSLYLTGDHIIFETDSTTIRYLFAPDYIIRNSSITDTFRVNVDNLQVSFAAQELIQSPDTLEKHLADAISFNMIFKSDSLPFSYHKQYSSANFIH